MLHLVSQAFLVKKSTVMFIFFYPISQSFLELFLQSSVIIIFLITVLTIRCKNIYEIKKEQEISNCFQQMSYK